MKRPFRREKRHEHLLHVERSGLKALLLSLLHPTDAKGATLGSDDVSLDLFTKTLKISFDQIEGIFQEKSSLGHSVKLQLTDTEKSISGLSRSQAQALWTCPLLAQIFRA